MGKETILAAILLTSLGAVITLVSLFFPFYSFSVSATVKHAIDVSLHVLSTEIEIKDAENVCARLEEFKVASDFCDQVKGSVSLEQASTAFCGDGAKAFFSGACPSMGSAHTLGVILVAAVVGRITLDGVALWRYMQCLLRPNPWHRKLAFVCQVLSAPLVALPLMLYYKLVIVRLNGLELVPTESSQAFSFLLDKKQPNIGPAYGGLWVGFLIQLVAILLGQVASASEHERYNEAAAQQGFMAEMQSMGPGSSRDGLAERPRPSQQPDGVAPRVSKAGTEQPTGVPFEKKASFVVGGASCNSSFKAPPEEWGNPWDRPVEDVEDPPEEQPAK